jgi:SnoaL-like domain
MTDKIPVGADAPIPSLPAWGHGAGLLALRDSTAPSDIAETADRLLIIERVHRYCWAYDERRRERLADCFTEDAIWEGSVLGQVAVGPFRGRTKIIEWLCGFWPYQHDQRRHMILNTIVEEQTKSQARTLSYLLLASSNAKSISIETMGFYRVAYRRSGAAWQIEHLAAGFDAPFWPGDIQKMSRSGQTRHGVSIETENLP